VARYSVMMLREMSQVVTVEASSIDEAAQLAFDQNNLSANIGNDFDDSGEVEIYNVSDAKGNEVWNMDTGRELNL
jgi:hypothetical protein